MSREFTTIQKNQDKNTKIAITFPANVFTVTFSNQEQYDITNYDPKTRCKSIRSITQRDFTSGKSTSSVSVEDQMTGVDISGITNKSAKDIADILLKKQIDSNGDKLNGAQLVGILANIEAESNYSTSKVNLVNNVEYIGICQWSSGRATEMKNKCGTNWQANLLGQVDYMWSELIGSYKSNVLNPMLNASKENTKKAAYAAMEIFCKNYKKVNNYDTEITKRKKIVDKLWKQIKITGFISTGNKSYKLSDEKIKRLVVGCIQENGSSQKAIQAEASLMCNLTERSSKYNDVYDYVLNSRWFGRATRDKIRGSSWKNVTANQYNWGYAIFNGGLRTIPTYVNEHDWFPNDISWIKYNGDSDTKVHSGFSRNKLISGKSIIHNIYGSTYTFWLFMKPNNAGDPYGSTYYPKRY